MHRETAVNVWEERKEDEAQIDGDREENVLQSQSKQGAREGRGSGAVGEERGRRRGTKWHEVELVKLVKLVKLLKAKLVKWEEQMNE